MKYREKPKQPIVTYHIAIHEGEHPRVAALREFITDWYVTYLSTDDARGLPEAGPQERLSKMGDNLPI